MNEIYYPPTTGDSPLLIRYERSINPTSRTVGIENDEQPDGIQWLCDGTYRPQAAPLQDGTAILFMAVLPGQPHIPWPVPDDTTVGDSAGGAVDGVVQPG